MFQNVVDDSRGNLNEQYFARDLYSFETARRRRQEIDQPGRNILFDDSGGQSLATVQVPGDTWRKSLPAFVLLGIRCAVVAVIRANN